MNYTLGFELISRGGPLMIALLICSIISLAIIIERLFFLRFSSVLRPEIMKKIKTRVSQGDIDGALRAAEENDSPMMRVALAALVNRHKSAEDLKTSVEDAGRLEVPLLEKFMTPLQTIAVISPLLGLLGTVTGMIKVFETVMKAGTGDASLLAGGISEALITTAAGLSIAIPTLVFFNFFSGKAEDITIKMEYNAAELQELLTQNRSQ